MFNMYHVAGRNKVVLYMIVLIGLITMHADRRMTLNYSQYVCDVLLFFETDQKNQSYPTFLNLYTKLP